MGFVQKAKQKSVRHTGASHHWHSVNHSVALGVRQWVKLGRHAGIKVNGPLVQMAAEKTSSLAQQKQPAHYQTEPSGPVPALAASSSCSRKWVTSACRCYSDCWYNRCQCQTRDHNKIMIIIVNIISICIIELSRNRGTLFISELEGWVLIPVWLHSTCTFSELHSLRF